MKNVSGKFGADGRMPPLAFLLLFVSFAFSGNQSFRSDWKLDGPIIAAGMAGQALAQWKLERMTAVDPMRLDRGAVQPFDRWAIGYYSPAADLASDWLFLAGVWPLAAYGRDSYLGLQSWEDFGTDLIMLTEILFLNSALNLSVRSLRVHPRPLVYESQASDAERLAGEAAGSFYSGHASTAFALAVFSGYTHQVKYPESIYNKWIWMGGLSSATAVALLRVSAGKHFPSDIAAGAAIGAAIGYGVVRLHRVRARGLVLVPVPSGMVAIYNF